MSYATIEDIQNRITRTLTAKEQEICNSLLDDAAVIIDTFNAEASNEAKLIVSCRMVIRAISVDDASVPMGATQGSMSALGYSQSWTIGTGGSVGELYLTRLDKQLLGIGSQIGSYSPVEELVPDVEG